MAGSKPVIGTVMRQGYKLGEQVLRHALVGVVDTVADGCPAGVEGEAVDTADNAGGSGEHTAESEASSD